MNCQRCKPKCEGTQFPQRHLRGKDRGGSGQAGIWFCQCEVWETQLDGLSRAGWLHMESKSQSSEHSFISAKIVRRHNGARVKVPTLPRWAGLGISLLFPKEWRRNTRSILQGSWIAQPFAFFSNTGVKTAFLARKKWTLIMTYQNKKNDVGKTNNTNNFNGICNVRSPQFFVKYLFIIALYNKYSNAIWQIYNETDKNSLFMKLERSRNTIFL